jgi:hypothetical protein
MRAGIGAVLWFGFAAYCIAWVIVAFASDPTWWWFIPIYGDIKIFSESVWWGLFHIGVLPALFLVGAIMEA